MKTESEALTFPPVTFTTEELAGNGNDVKCAIRYHALALVAADHVKVFGDNAFAIVETYKDSANFFQNLADGKISAEDMSRRARPLIELHYKKYPMTDEYLALSRSAEIIERCEMILAGMRAMDTLQTRSRQALAHENRERSADEKLLMAPPSQEVMDALKAPAVSPP